MCQILFAHAGKSIFESASHVLLLGISCKTYTTGNHHRANEHSNRRHSHIEGLLAASLD